MTSPHAFRLEATPIHVPDEVIDDLCARLALTRPPVDEGNGDWSYGVPESYLRELVAYWRDGFDWRKAEAAINAYEHHQVSVAGIPVHFIRKPGRGPRPIPLILTHGWPWTFWHWSKVIDPLADPAAFGGDPADAFDVIVPSLPGFGFPGPLTGFADVNFWKVADLWHTLMTETLGYEMYAAGGCDIGGIVSSQLGHKYADELYGSTSAPVCRSTSSPAPAPGTSRGIGPSPTTSPLTSAPASSSGTTARRRTSPCTCSTARLWPTG
jgi:pimeloyl-ACP methyl ester carboxylesterase